MLKFAPIMPAFCLLPLYSYYANNFAGKINASLVNMHVGEEIIMGGWVVVKRKSIEIKMLTHIVQIYVCGIPYSRHKHNTRLYPEVFYRIF